MKELYEDKDEKEKEQNYQLLQSYFPAEFEKKKNNIISYTPCKDIQNLPNFCKSYMCDSNSAAPQENKVSLRIQNIF